MQAFNIGDTVKIKSGVTARVRKSSMIHWRMCPDLDGITFTIEKLTKNQKGCYISAEPFNNLLYALPFRNIEKVTQQAINS